MDQLETLPLDAGGEANVLLKQEEFAEAAPAEEALPVGEPGDEYNDADYDEALDPDYAEEGAEEGAEEEEHDDIEEEAPNLEDLELKDAVKTKEKEKQGSKLQRRMLLMKPCRLKPAVCRMMRPCLKGTQGRSSSRRN